MKKTTIQKWLFQFISWGGIIILIWAIFSNCANGQTHPPAKKIERGFVSVVEKMPILKSCESQINSPKAKKCMDEQVKEIIYSNLEIPQRALQNSIEGTVVIQFMVEIDGSASGHKIMRDIGGGCGEEALRVVKLLSDWSPGELRGKKVRVRYNMPVKFKN